MQELNNPGFEEGMPSNWQTYSTGKMHVYTYPEKGRLEGSSVAIEYPTIEVDKTASWIQTVKIDSKKKYKLSGYMKTQNIIGGGGSGGNGGSGASINVDWKDANGKYLSTSVIMTRKTETTSWTYYEGIVTPNPGAARATIVLDLFDCSGKAWFDDISFSDTVTKRYKCGNGMCTEDPNGKYGSIDECSTALKYACVNGQCVGVCPDYQGTKYNSMQECKNVCGQNRPGYTLVFEDHFNGTNLDDAKWTPTYGSYKVENSNLILGVDNNGGEIRGIKEDNSAAKWQFKYGYVEYRAKLADAGNNRGYCNQLWFVDSPGQSPYGEINITETATGPMDRNTGNPYGINKLNTTVHCPTQPNERTKKIDTGLNLSQDYHIYAAEWTPGFVRFIFDGNEVFRVNSTDICIPDVFMYLIVGLCKRPDTTDQSQCWPAVEPGNVPAKLYVDYIQVYQKSIQKKYKCSGTPNYRCTEDPNGQFLSIEECQAICKQGYKLIWNDEFEGSKLDTSKWNTANSGGDRASQITVSDGNLKIKAELIDGVPYSGYMTTRNSDGTSKFRFKYGLIEWRAKMAHGDGARNQFWCAAGYNDAHSMNLESAISADTYSDQESYPNLYLPPGDNHREGEMSIDYSGGNADGGGNAGAIGWVGDLELDKDFHTYQMEWKSEYVIFRIDGAEKYRIAGNKVPSLPLDIFIALCLGQCNITWGKDLNKSQLPFEFLIDYVRVYQTI